MMETSNNIVLNEGQQKAAHKLLHWYNLSNERYFSIAGSAGTGKSTMLSEALKLLNIDMRTEVAYATPTGKAALVLKLKGLNASTVHRLIYRPEINNVPMLDKDGKVMTEHSKDKDGNLLFDANGQPILTIKMKQKLIFKKREQLEDEIKLIVIDEGSMISLKMWQDILSFGKRVVILSDHKQLPPIGSNIIDPVKNPHVTLTEIMRQGKDSDILTAADRASRGLLLFDELSKKNNDVRISYANRDVHIISHHHLSDELLKKAGIVICGRNSTRSKLNKYIREKVYGFSGELPQKGDKLICRRNNNEEFLRSNTEITLTNGLIGTVQNHIDLEMVKKETFTLDFKPEFIKDDAFENLEVNKHLITGRSPKNPLKNLTTEEKNELMNFGKGNKFEYGYCITTHLSQGSEWDTVIVFFEWLGDRDTVCKWLYTAITRAKRKIIIVRSIQKGETPYWER